jgi:hypothetical protein
MLEGIPAVVLGALMWFLLVRRRAVWSGVGKRARLCFSAIPILAHTPKKHYTTYHSQHPPNSKQPDDPSSLRGLAPNERQALSDDLAVEAKHEAERRATPSWRLLLAAVKGRFFPLCAAVNFVAGIVATAYVSWMPL